MVFRVGGLQGLAVTCSRALSVNKPHHAVRVRYNGFICRPGILGAMVGLELGLEQRLELACLRGCMALWTLFWSLPCATIINPTKAGLMPNVSAALRMSVG